MDKKRKGDDLQHSCVKKQRTDDREIPSNYLEVLPTEILLAVAKFAGAFPIAVLSLTSKQFNELFSDNHWWYALYNCERDINRTAVDLVNSTLNESLGKEPDEYHLDRWDDELTKDAAQLQRELLLDDDCIKHLTEEDFPLEEKEVARKLLVRYDAQADYKELAIDEWLKRQYFEIWNDTTCATLNRTECSCAHKECLQLYAEDGTELELGDAADESDSLEHEDSTVESFSDEELSSQSLDDECSSEDGDVVPCILTPDLRQQIIASVADSAQLKVFVQVLDAVVLGHIPAATCPDTEVIALMKLKYNTVLFGSVLDEVTAQIAQAVNLDARICLKMLFCAFQKLSLSDLFYLNQGVRAQFPYLANVFAAKNVERSVPLCWFDLVCGNEPHWACDFRASLASQDELDAVPDWLSLRHSVLGLMRKYVASASPSMADHGVEALVEFIAKILQRVVDTKSAASSSSIEISEVDILRAVSKEPRTTDYKQPYIVYRPSKLMAENAVVLCSDSDCSYSSSYEDESAEDEDLNQFLVENMHNILVSGIKPAPGVDDSKIQDEDTNSMENVDDHYELTAQIKAKVSGLENDTSPLLLRSAVVYGQTDLTEQLNDVADTDGLECSEGELIEDELMNWLDVDTDSYNADYVEKMVHTLKQDAAYYAGSGEVGERAEESISLIDSIVPSDLPDLRPDISVEQRATILEARRETNRILKEEIRREHEEYLSKKYDRLCRSYAECNNSSGGRVCQSMELNFFSDNVTNVNRTISKAVQLIGAHKELKTITLRDYIEEDASRVAYGALFGAIAASPVESLKLYGCQLADAKALTDLLKDRKLRKFNFSCSRCVKGSTQLFNQLATHSSLRELALDYPNMGPQQQIVNQTLAALNSCLDVLQLRLYRIDLPFMGDPLRKWSSVKRIELQFHRHDMHYVMCNELADLRNELIEAGKPAVVTFAQY